MEGAAPREEGRIGREGQTGILRDSRARERTSVVVTGVVVLSNDADGRLLGCWVVSNGTFLCDTSKLDEWRVFVLCLFVALIGRGDPC
jgi:hypothetical protein